MFRIKKSVRIVKIDCTYIFKGTDNVGTYAILNEVVSIGLFHYLTLHPYR